MRMFKCKTAIFGLVLCLGAAGQAMAQKPNVVDGGNLWYITAYDDTSSVHSQWATQGICFIPYSQKGTHIQGLWYSTTFPNWRGRYSQEGDRLLMHGEYAENVGNDAMVIELFAGTTPRDEGAGQWLEWRDTGPHGRTIVFGNCRLRRVGKCPLPKGIEDLSEAEREKLSAQLSSRVRPRLTRDGKEATSPTDPNSAPLPEKREKSEEVQRR
jgi:hypothetical protein